MVSDVVMNVANIFSTITIFLCLFLKIPQIWSIQKRQCADGIYVKALLMEVTGFSVMTMYNFMNRYSLLTYLEYPIILCQVYIMFYFVLKYKGLLNDALVPVGTLTYSMFMLLLMFEVIPKSLLSYLVPLCTPLSAFAKISYIYGIIEAGNSDSISYTTWVISIFTNLVRIFTVFVDSCDAKLLINFTVSAMLSTGVLVTALMYKTTSCVERQHSPPIRRKRANRYKYD